MPDHTELEGCTLAQANEMIVYQAMARRAFEVAGDADLEPLVWMRSTCGNQCLNPAHLIVHQPIRIAYPSGVCVYCGFPSGTKDHLIPKTWTGDTRRARVAVVPACAECNSLIHVSGSFNVSERRRIAQAKLAKKHRAVLAGIDWTDEQLAEFGPNLRSSLTSALQKKRALQSRLSWPEDPFYDIRAWQLSGIDDPVSLDVADAPQVGVAA